jgi:hypothetical protein
MTAKRHGIYASKATYSMQAKKHTQSNWTSLLLVTVAVACGAEPGVNKMREVNQLLLTHEGPSPVVLLHSTTSMLACWRPQA